MSVRNSAKNAEKHVLSRFRRQTCINTPDIVYEVFVYKIIVVYAPKSVLGFKCSWMRRWPSSSFCAFWMASDNLIRANNLYLTFKLCAHRGSTYATHVFSSQYDEINMCHDSSSDAHDESVLQIPYDDFPTISCMTVVVATNCPAPGYSLCSKL